METKDYTVDERSRYHHITKDNSASVFLLIIFVSILLFTDATLSTQALLPEGIKDLHDAIIFVLCR